MTRPMTGDTKEHDDMTLPMSVIVLCYREAGDQIAHCLDMDLVCSGSTQHEAQRLLEIAIQTHVEHALERDAAYSIRKPAPKKYWDMILSSGISGETRVIKIHDRMVCTTTHEIGTTTIGT